MFASDLTPESEGRNRGALDPHPLRIDRVGYNWGYDEKHRRNNNNISITYDTNVSSLLTKFTRENLRKS
jgi:hypothetical protein